MLATSFTSFEASRGLRDQQDRQVHTLKALLAADRAEIAALQVIRGERGYLLTANREFLEPYQSGIADLDKSIDTIARITADNPRQTARIAVLRREADALERVADEVVTLTSQGNTDTALRIVRDGRGRAALNALTGTIDQVMVEERALLAERTQRTDLAARWQTITLAILAMCGVAMIALSLFAITMLRRAFGREAAYRAQLRRLALTDELTGLANRRETLAGLDRALASAQRDGRPLAFATLDIDHFKRVNDTFGHPAGDEVIRRVAQTAIDAVRGGDLVGRLGGEEFAIVLPGASQHEAAAVCERLRLAVQRTPVALPDGRFVRVSVSTGITQHRLSDDAAALIARADTALYDAKQGGRDQVRLAA